jgi:hypothetical protein
VLATTAVKESGAERHPDQTAQQHTGTEDEKIWSRPSCFAVPVTLLWEHFLKTLIGGCLKKQDVKKVHKIKRPFWPFPWLYYGSIF